MSDDVRFTKIDKKPTAWSEEGKKIFETLDEIKRYAKREGLDKDGKRNLVKKFVGTLVENSALEDADVEDEPGDEPGEDVEDEPGDEPGEDVEDEPEDSKNWLDGFFDDNLTSEQDNAPDEGPEIPESVTIEFTGEYEEFLSEKEIFSEGYEQWLTGVLTERVEEIVSNLKSDSETVDWHSDPSDSLIAWLDKHNLDQENPLLEGLMTAFTNYQDGLHEIEDLKNVLVTLILKGVAWMEGNESWTVRELLDALVTFSEDDSFEAGELDVESTVRESLEEIDGTSPDKDLIYKFILMWSLRDIESKIEILEVDGEAQLEAENALRNLLRACFLLIVEILHDEGKISDEKKALLEGAVDEIVDEIGWTPSNE
jgi:hypothetical protein